MKKHFILSVAASSLLLSGCYKTGWDFLTPEPPAAWTAYQNELVETAEVQDLKEWWVKFDDQTLNALVALSLEDSPDRLIAEARILEARGIRRSARSALFPQLDVSGSKRREDSGFPSTPDTFYDAGFDASYELDIFGKNRNDSKASKKSLEALESSYHDVSLTLVAEVARTYIEYRAYQKQVSIAKTNLDVQKKTLKLVKTQKELGEAPQLDVERSENLVNTTKASIPEFQRLAENARLRLSVLTGHLSEDLTETLSNAAPIPGADVKPVLLAPADVLALRPDVRAAASNLEASTASADSATADFFPSITLSGFFGVTDGSFVNSATIWNVAIGSAVSLLDFGRIEGQIDAARAREKQAYEQYRKTVLEAVNEVETALNDYAHINEQRLSLKKAYANAERSLNLSQTLFKKGEVSFIDVLDAQRTVNQANASLVTAEAAQASSLIALYKSLGVY